MANQQGKQAVLGMIAERKERLQVLDEERKIVDSELTGLELALQAFPDDAGNVQAYADEDAYKTIGQIVGDAIYDVLVEVGGPLHRDVLFDRVVAKGIVIEAANPKRYFFNFLTSDPRFKSKPGTRGYWMLAEPEDGPPETC